MNALLDLMTELKGRRIRLWLEDGKLRYAAPRGTFDDSLKVQVREHRDAIIDRLATSAAKVVGVKKVRDRHLPAPLSSAQLRLWFLERLRPGTYHCPTVIALGGALRPNAVEKAFGQLVARHEILRTRYSLGADGPEQVVNDVGPFALEVHDCTEDGQSKHQAQTYVDTFFRRPFKLDEELPLRAAGLRMPDGNDYLLLSIHHIATDGWSVGILGQELRSLIEGQPLAPVPFQYLDYATWQKRWLDDVVRPRSLPFWLDALRDAPAELELPMDFPRAAVFSGAGALYGRELGFGLSESAVGAAARGFQVTPYMLLMAGFHVLLHRYTGAEDLCVGTPVANRGAVEFERTLGCFVNTVVIRGRPTASKSFRAFLQEIKATTLDAFEHEALPFEEVVEAMDLPRDTARHALFQVMFALQTTEGAGATSLAVRDGALAVREIGAKFDLNVSLVPVHGRYQLECEYATGLFLPNTVVRMVAQFERLMVRLMAQPDLPVGLVDYLGEDERGWLARAGRGPCVALPSDGTSVDLIRGQVRAGNDAVAIRFRDQVVRYGEVRVHVDTVKRAFVSAGLRRGHVCGLLMERQVDLVFAMLAVLELGAAYLPIDPELPVARKRFMVEDAGVTLLATTAKLAVGLDVLPARVLAVDALEVEPEAPGAAATPSDAAMDPGPDDLGYVIYTSGTTGRPKGVGNQHRGLLNRILWMQKRHAIGPGDTVLQKTNYAFDVSVWEIIWPLAYGATLCLAEPRLHGDPLYLQDAIARYGVTILHFVPSMFGAFLSTAKSTALQSLRAVFVSGEALPPATVDDFEALGLSANLYNLYGPTEAAIDVTHWDCAERPLRRGLVPIGRPIDNIDIRILDAVGGLVPRGVYGELCIGGVGVATGYLGRAALTASKYRPDPDEVGGRLFWTGDRARWLGDGTIEYGGRLDTQVKLRGFRIELGEIEEALSRLSEVEQAVVCVVPRLNGASLLVAYLVADDPRHNPPSSNIVRDTLTSSLPAYMVPDRFEWIEAIPTGATGKADRKALAAQPLSGPSTATLVAPEGATQELLATIWSDVLGIGRVSASQGFFELGGNSLALITVQSQILDRIGREVSLVDLFSHPTIRGLAAHLDGGRTRGGDLERDLKTGQAGAARLAQMRRARTRQNDRTNTSGGGMNDD